MFQKYLFAAITCAIFALFFIGMSRNIPKTKIPLRDRMDLAIKHEFDMTKDPLLNDVPKERLIEAKRIKDEWIKKNETRAAIAGVEWHELGPDNVAGRTRTILVDANDATGKTVFAGSVGGGLWKTTDITAPTPTWLAIDNLMENLAITSIAQDPSNPNTIYFATGEGYFNLDAIRGLGVWKSTDGGLTWAQLPSTNNSNFYYCQKITVNNTGVVFVASSTGLRRSSDGGTTWTKVLGAGLGIVGAGNNFAYDVEVAANGDIYASLDGSIHKSTNAGVTFGAAMTLPITAARIELACAPSDANYAYALIENASAVNGILRTTNGGTTWVARTEPDDADGGIPATDFSRTQAWYDLAIAVDPNNRDVLMVGGVDLFKSTDGAGTWTQISHWYGGFGSQYVHADQHYIYYKAGSSSEAYFANDGGVWRTANANAAIPTIGFKGDNYNVTQFYACAIHPTAQTSYYLAGSQDNGSHQFQSDNIQSTVEVTGGDGAFCHIDQNQPQYQFTSYVYNDFYRSADGGASWTNVSTTGGSFISPTDYDDVNNRMYMRMGNNNYGRWDNPQTGSTFATVAAAAFGGSVVSVRVSPNTNNRVFFGINNGDVCRVDNAHTAAPTITNISTGLPTGNPSCIEVQTGNDNHLLVVYSNYGVNSVWESTDAGVTWTSVEGNLPDMPIRWALFNPNNADQAMLATELGIWTTDNLNAGATVWGSSNTGIANTRVDMLQMRQSDKIVVAATHGRGMFWTDAFAAPTARFSANAKLTYLYKDIQFLDNSYKATAWLWDFGDGTTSSAQNPTHNYTTPGLYNVTLTINGGASTLTQTSFVHILPDKSTPYAITDGGNFEVNPLDFGNNLETGTPWQRGNSAVAGKNGNVSASNAWVTGLTGNYANNSISQLWTPHYSFASPGTYTLSFQAKYNTEAGYDGFRVEYSTDKGDTWLPLGTTTAAGWYNFANTAGDAAFPVNQAFFAGNSSAAFTLRSRDVSFLAGSPSVAFRFAFRSDVAVLGAGIAIDNFSITGPPNNPLPVNITDFSATNQPDYIALQWQSHNEVELSHYELERSEDKTYFAKIAEISAQNRNQNSYTYKDPSQNFTQEVYTYRLKAIDINGSITYSNKVEVSIPQKAADVLLYPNPFDASIYLQSHKPIDYIAFFNPRGQLVFESKEVNANMLSLPEDLLKGIYLVKVVSDGKTTYKKMIKK